MTTVMLDCNIFDKLAVDQHHRDALGDLVSSGRARVIATPVLVEELGVSPFGGLPDWFPIDVEPENVAVLGFAQLGMVRLGDGEVYQTHRGSSSKIKDGILADSANALADILVSEDSRCRKRLAAVSSSCHCLSYSEFCSWLDDQTSRPAV